MNQSLAKQKYTPPKMRHAYFCFYAMEQSILLIFIWPEKKELDYVSYFTLLFPIP